MIVELERGPRLGSLKVAKRDDEVWLRYLGGKSPNIRLMDALYTYSRTENDKVIFRYRRSREIEKKDLKMTYEELDLIEEGLRKVDQFTPGSYGIVTALMLVEELRKYIPRTPEPPTSGSYKVGQLPVELL